GLAASPPLCYILEVGGTSPPFSAPSDERRRHLSKMSQAFRGRQVSVGLSTNTPVVSVRSELADYVAQLPCLPYVEQFRHHVQLYARVLMFTEALILIAFNGIDILNVARYRDRGAHRVCHTGHRNNQQTVQPQLIQAQPRAALSRILIHEHS